MVGLKAMLDVSFVMCVPSLLMCKKQPIGAYSVPIGFRMVE